MTVRVAPLVVPEEVFLRDTDRKRAKKGILGGSEERVVFAKTIFLPYLDFTYRFPAEKGLLAPMLTDMQEDSSSIVTGIDSTVIVSERLAELKNLLRDYEVQSEERSKQYEALPKESPARENLKENIEFLRKTKLLRWKMFADGLQLPPKIDLDTAKAKKTIQLLTSLRRTISSENSSRDLYARRRLRLFSQPLQ